MVSSMWQSVLDFWFKECEPKQWFDSDPVFDLLVGERFDSVLTQAKKGELFEWRIEAAGRLAEIIVLDQFSRNIYRDSADAFAADAQALVLAQEAVLAGCDEALPAEQRAFLYMPYMHSESKLMHEHAVVLFSASGLEENLAFEEKHKAIIDRFGRYPHRNKLLGRQSTSEELDFLTEPDSSF